MRKFLFTWLLSALLCIPVTTPAWSQGTLDAAIGKLTHDIQTTLHDKATIAFIPLEDAAPLARDHAVGMAITEFLSAKLLKSDTFAMVERGRLNHVLDELELSRSGLIDRLSAVETGKLVAADTILCGTITAIGRFFDVNIRAIDAKSGLILQTFVAEIAQDVFVVERPSRMLERVQVSLDALDQAIVAFHQLSYNRLTNTFYYPKNLQALVPRHIDRLPDPIQGKWQYTHHGGIIRHSLYPELQPTAPRQNLQTYADQAMKASLQGRMSSIRMALMNYYAEMGETPAELSTIKTFFSPSELPDAFDGKWVWNQATGTLSHSKHPDLTMQIQ